MEPAKPFRVLVCEVATGIVCKPDGLRWRSDRNIESEKFLRFATRPEAMDFIHVSCETRPHLECHLYDEEEHLGRFTNESAA